MSYEESRKRIHGCDEAQWNDENDAQAQGREYMEKRERSHLANEEQFSKKPVGRSFSPTRRRVDVDVDSSRIQRSRPIIYKRAPYRARLFPGRIPHVMGCLSES